MLSSIAEASVAAFAEASGAWLSMLVACPEPWIGSSPNRVSSQPWELADGGRSGERMPLHAATEVAASSISRAGPLTPPLTHATTPAASAPKDACVGVATGFGSNGVAPEPAVAVQVAPRAADAALCGSTGAEARCCRDCSHAVCLARRRSCTAALRAVPARPACKVCLAVLLDARSHAVAASEAGSEGVELVPCSRC